MKFNDGFWLLKSNVKPFYALQIANTKESVDGYEFYVSTRPIKHRGDTLGGPVFTVNLSSPTEGVIGVKLGHFGHAPTLPEVPLFPNAAPLQNYSLSERDGDYFLSSGGLTAHVTQNPYTITFKSENRTLTFSGPKHQALYDVPAHWTMNSASNSSCLATDLASNPNREGPSDVVRYIHSELNISPGELIYGFGETFGAFVKNGQSISIWNQDGGTSSEQAYKCVPFYITNRGYGVFINNPGEVEVEVGSEKVSRVGVSASANSLEYFIIYGEKPLEILERYTRLTGRPALLPTWSYGLWLSTSFLTSYSSQTVSGFLEGMKERSCPVRVFHLDCFWMKQYEWCSFTFDPNNFPDPKAYLSEIKNKYNVKICLWINPYISQLSPIFQEGAKGGYFIKRKDGTPWQWDLWQPGLAIVDFTNPAARRWYTEKLSALLDLGVDAFKTDFGERIPHADVVYYDNSEPKRMHNMYSIIYNELVFNLLRDRFGEGQAIVFARSSAAGGQRFPVHWGGDCESTWEAMAEALRGALSLTVSGFAFASHDIGGFEGHPPPEIYQRWVAFGLFSTHSRLHGSSSYRIPWQYGEGAAQIMAKLLDIKHRLMPYLLNYSIESHNKGHPLMRAMFLEFISDRTTHYLDRQYMLGPNILVAPVFVPLSEKTEYYLPAGIWTSFFHPKRVLTGPTWVKEHVPIDEIPVWIRQDSLIALGPPGTGKPDYDYTCDLELNIYALRDGGSVTTHIPRPQGDKTAGSIKATRTGNVITVDIDNELKATAISIYEPDTLSVEAKILKVKIEVDQKKVVVQL